MHNCPELHRIGRKCGPEVKGGAEGMQAIEGTRDQKIEKKSGNIEKHQNIEKHRTIKKK